MNRSILVSTMIIFTVIFGCNQSIGLDYDYTSTKNVKLEFYPEIELSTKDGIIEGEVIPLKTINDVYVGNKLILNKGTIVHAKVGTAITAGMNGFPAEIIINDFEIPGIDSEKIFGEYSKLGQNRCLWVYPLKWALTPFPPTGSLTNFIYGGHAKLKTTDKITIYYYPEW